MKTVFERLREHLLAAVRPEAKRVNMTPAEILDAQVSFEFLRLMGHGVTMGRFRYGPIRGSGLPPTKNIHEIRKRITLYEETGNQEHLVDVANFAMVEYMKPCHPNPHFEASDDGVHAERNDA